jgi:hypothetical protein
MKNSSSSSSHQKSIIQHNKQLAKRVQAKVYIHDISILISIEKKFAQNYLITDNNLKKLCDQNIMTTFQLKRYDIAKVTFIYFIYFFLKKNNFFI